MNKLVGLLTLISAFSFAASNQYLIKIKAKDKYERTKISTLGLAIDAVYSDSVASIGSLEQIKLLKKNGFKYEATEIDGRDFPTSDKIYHTFDQTIDTLNALEKKYPAIVSRFTMGKSVEGRELAGVRLSSKYPADSLPTAIFMGCHHAREHLSVEVPLKLAVYLAENYSKDTRIKNLLDTREVWIVPMVNPDGAEYDISTGSYKLWRKNRAKGGYGVDLNRNYSKGWGGQGSSGNQSSDTYRGPSAFSEPETQAVRDFVKARKNTRTLLTYHTFSELVMWPWGHTYNKVSSTDNDVFEKMGKKMASWNGYKAQKSSELYLASGDTTDWAYDTLKIFAFTFELSPSSSSVSSFAPQKGFYPGAAAVETTFKANIEPALYLIEKAENPYTALR